MLNKKTKKIIVLTSIIGIITSLSFITPMISLPIYLSKKHCNETEILPVNNAQTKDNEAININNKINNILIQHMQILRNI